MEPLFSTISCSVLAAGHYGFPPDWRLDRGAVLHSRLFVVTGGHAVFTVDGASYSVEAGGIILVPPRTMHQVQHDPLATLSAYVIDFEAKLHGILDVATVCGLPVSTVPSAERRPKIALSAHNIVHHLTKLVPGWQLAIHTHCVRLLDLLWKESLAVRHQPEIAGDIGEPGALSRFWPVFRLVEQRFGERLALRDLAGAVHLHPAYFSAVFKRAAGIGPHEYVARFRLERARDLLVASDAPLDEIARRTGFYDAAHLIRLFRRFEGISPGRYRRTSPYGTRTLGAVASSAVPATPPIL